MRRNQIWEATACLLLAVSVRKQGEDERRGRLALELAASAMYRILLPSSMLASVGKPQGDEVRPGGVWIGDGVWRVAVAAGRAVSSVKWV